MAFDSTIGNCLDALHSRAPANIVRLTAAELVSVFYRSLQKTKSADLQVKFVAFEIIEHTSLLYNGLCFGKY